MVVSPRRWRDTPSHGLRSEYLRQRASHGQTTVVGASRVAEIRATYGRRRRHRETLGWHTFRHIYSTLLRSVGTEFKVMQELLRHSRLRSTLDIYTQAITPAKRAAQVAVLSLVFPETQGSAAAKEIDQ